MFFYPTRLIYDPHMEQIRPTGELLRELSACKLGNGRNHEKVSGRLTSGSGSNRIRW